MEPVVRPVSQPYVAPVVMSVSQTNVAPVVTPMSQPTVAPVITPTSQPYIAPVVTSVSQPTVLPRFAPTSQSYAQPVVMPGSQPTVTHAEGLPFTPLTLHVSHATVISHSAATSSLARVFADSVNLNRLPIPEPSRSVFTGDPLRFVEWKTAFHALIERKGIPEQERLSYLKPVKHCRPLMDCSTVEVALHMETLEKSSKTGMFTHLFWRKHFVRD